MKHKIKSNISTLTQLTDGEVKFSINIWEEGNDKKYILKLRVDNLSIRRDYYNEEELENYLDGIIAGIIIRSKIKK